MFYDAFTATKKFVLRFEGRQCLRRPVLILRRRAAKLCGPARAQQRAAILRGVPRAGGCSPGAQRSQPGGAKPYVFMEIPQIRRPKQLFYYRNYVHIIILFGLLGAIRHFNS